MVLELDGEWPPACNSSSQPWPTIGGEFKDTDVWVPGRDSNVIGLENGVAIGTLKSPPGDSIVQPGLRAIVQGDGKSLNNLIYLCVCNITLALI